MPDITVVIPTHGARVNNGMTAKAIGSVLAQTLPAKSIIVEVDNDREGAAVTRHRGLMKVTTEWVAFLDSDDSFYPHHLETLAQYAEETGADFLFPHPIAWGASSPFAKEFGVPWDNDNPRHTTIVVMVKTALAQEVGFLNHNPLTPDGESVSDEDWLFMMGCRERGAKIVHVPEKTWLWNLHGLNSAGIPGQGDAPPRV